MTTETLRRCIKCGRHRPPGEFPPRRRQCKPCVYAAAKERREVKAAARIEEVEAELEESGELLETEGWRVIEFIEAHCVFTQGDFVGQPFVLLPWQRELLLELFRLRPDGIRQYRRAYIGVPKKNGKTELCAALGLYFLIAGRDPTPDIPICASSEDQADLLFSAARTMCEQSETLKALTEVWSDEITCPTRPGARLRRVATAAGGLDGPNVSASLLDELHEWKTPRALKTWTVLSRGSIARANSLMIMITTAGDDRDTKAYELYEYGRQIEEGTVTDPSFLFRWWSAPEALPYDSREAFEAANPSAGETVTYARLSEDLPSAPEYEIRRYHLNQWTQTTAAWLPPGTWDACARPDEELRKQLPTRIAVDAATAHDSCAVIWGQCIEGQAVPGDDGPVIEPDRWIVRSRVWARPRGPDGKPVRDWLMPIADIKAFLRELRERYMVEEIIYDPAFLTWASDELEAEGWPMVKCPQTAGNMVPGSQALYTQLLHRQIAHDGDPVFARHIASAVSVQSSRGGWRLAKNKAREHMDAAIALAMFVWSYLQPEDEPEPEPAVYVFDEDGNLVEPGGA